MSTKHTKGPWRVGYDKTHAVYILNDGPLMFGKSGESENKANAQLIAAAPEMLDTLKKMVGYANFLDGMYGPNSVEKRDFLELIAKAEGGES